MHRLVVAQRRATHAFTYLAVTHALLILVSLFAAIVWQMPAALVLAGPSLVIVTLTVLGRRPVAPGVVVAVDRPRALEGDTVKVRLSLHSPSPSPLVDVELVPEPDLDHVGPLRSLVSLPATSMTDVDFELVVRSWGVVPLGHISVRARDRFGLVAVTTWYQLVTPLRVHIHEESARRLTEPDRFRRLVGSHTSEDRAEGCEIADVRPYQPGDRLQALNWRISARNDEPWITLRHPDRSTSIVLLLDAHQRLGGKSADGLRRSIRATLGLARLHTDAQDPVALMIVGDGVRWLPAELGRAHLYRLTDALLELSRPNWSHGLDRPDGAHRRIPTNAVVLAVSPLIDARFVDLLMRLRARGQSVHVIEPTTNWLRHAVTGTGRRRLSPDRSWRIYRLQQQAVRTSLTTSGATVTQWTEGQPVDVALLGLRMAQRAQRIGVPR